MRILFYVEPFPIRNTFTHFSSVAKRFLSILDSDSAFDVRMFGNAETINQLGEVAANSARIIRATSDEEELFRSHLQVWQPDGIETWLDLMEGHERVTDDYVGVLRRIWSKFPFEVIIHWGENGAIRRFIEERPVVRIGMELGCTRPPFMESIAIDPFGTNGSGVVSKLTVEELRDIVANNPMSHHEALLGYSQNLESLGYEDQFLPLPQDITSRLTSGERIVFLPLQLFDDANLLRFSSYNTVEEVVMDVIPKLVERGYTVLVKPHPASEQRHSAATANAIARASLRQWWSKIIWCDHPKPISNARLISLSDFVVTVNSSVGFEALYYDKPVVVLGDAVYKPLDLFPTLDEMLYGQFDQVAFSEKAGILRRFVLGGYLQHDSIFKNSSLFLNHVASIEESYRATDGNPAAFSKNMWATCAASQSIARSAMFRGRSVAGVAEFNAPLGKTTLSISDNLSSQNQFSLFAWRLWLSANKPTAEALCAMLDLVWDNPERRCQLLREGQVVDPKFYLEKYPDVQASMIDPIEHYAHHGINENRIPQASMSSCSAQEILELLKRAVSSIIKTQEAPNFSLSENDAEHRLAQLEKIGAELSLSNKKVSVVAHLYYRDLVPGLIAKLKAIPEPFDLIITLPEWGVREIIKLVQESFPRAIFYHAINRGRDIAPFVDILPILFSKGYDAVLKLQTKRGYYKDNQFIPKLGDLWREETLDALLGDSDRVADILKAFRTHPRVSMIGPEPFLQPLRKYPYHDGGLLASALLAAPCDEGFFAGTMFWLRPACLKPLLNFSITNFAPEDGANDGAVAHLIERMFGQSAMSNGYQIVGAPVDPKLSLNYDIQPSPVSLHEYLSERWNEQRRTLALKPKGQLIW